ncbi:Got1 domain protein [Lentinula edodes]|uniref:Got1 domain protein n=1 Tax=Lentinula edodes TaxID=5353 RepID=A0A1Q3E9E3_LENED|nr:Got1 domain protein [Lentinula edodes]
MSAPPPYPYPPNENPDRRPLPRGWLTRYDNNYRAWFYVNTDVDPPVTTWTHPLGAPPTSPAPNSYGPPPGPPPPGPGSPGYGYNSQPQGQYPGYGGYREEESRGFFGRPSSNPPQQYAPAPPPKKSGPGMGTMLGVGAAGLLGGAVIGEMIEHHEDEEQFDAYQDGVQQGQMDDYGGGGDGFGGGDDFGGGGDW